MLLLSVHECLFFILTTVNILHFTFPAHLTLLHINDLHAHLDETNLYADGRCRGVHDSCVGGVARLYEAIRSIREVSTNRVWLLNAGDLFQGTIWYSVLKYSTLSEISNLLNYTAFALGNHEFDDGVAELSKFMTASRSYFDVLSCNLDTSKAPGINAKPYIIKRVDDVTVGIVGYVTSEVPSDISFNTNDKVKVTDEIESLKLVAQKLKDQQVDFIIALGHSGYEKDMEIAAQIEEIDLVVGGHSHTFLYPPDETRPSNEIPEGNYPTYVQNKRKLTPVVQAYCNGKYLGKLELELKKNEKLKVNSGDVILLNGTVREDHWINKMLDEHRETNLKEYYESIGRSNYDLVRNWRGESKLGDLIADAMMFVYKDQEVDFAFTHNKAIRADIKAGNLTVEDAFIVLPFNSTIDTAKISGKNFKSYLTAFIKGFSLHNESIPYRQFFLQISKELRLKYHIDHDSELMKNRVLSIEIYNANSTEKWSEMKDDKIYTVALTNYLAKHPFFKKIIFEHRDGSIGDYRALSNYIKTHSPLSNDVEDARITFTATASSNSNLTNKALNYHLVITVSFLLPIFRWFIFF